MRSKVPVVAVQPHSAAASRVTSFSAGFGAVREILKSPEYFARIDGVYLVDALYCGYVGDDPHSPEPGVINPVLMRDFLQFAQAAADGEKHAAVTEADVAVDDPDARASRERRLQVGFGERAVHADTQGADLDALVARRVDGGLRRRRLAHQLHQRRRRIVAVAVAGEAEHVRALAPGVLAGVHPETFQIELDEEAGLATVKEKALTALRSRDVVLLMAHSAASPAACSSFSIEASSSSSLPADARHLAASSLEAAEFMSLLVVVTQATRARRTR